MVLLISERFPPKVRNLAEAFCHRRVCTRRRRRLRAQKAKHSVNILLGGGALSPPSHNPFVLVRARMCVCVLFVCECVSQVSAKKAGAFE